MRHQDSRIVVGAVPADLLGRKGLGCGRVVGVGVVERMDRTKGMGNVKVGRMVVDHMIDRGFGRMIGHYRMGMEVVDRIVAADHIGREMDIVDLVDDHRTVVGLGHDMAVGRTGADHRMVVVADRSLHHHRSSLVLTCLCLCACFLCLFD